MDPIHLQCEAPPHPNSLRLQTDITEPCDAVTEPCDEQWPTYWLTCRLAGETVSPIAGVSALGT